MTASDLLTSLFLLVGAFFFLAGTVGILRFPDTLSRLHAVTKADNLGLGLIVVGLLFQAESVFGGLKLILIWGMVLLASATSCFLVAGAADPQRDESGETR